MGKLTILVVLIGFAAACGSVEPEMMDAPGSAGAGLAGSAPAAYVAGTGVSEAGRAAPKPVVDSGTPDAGQPVEVDAGHAAAGSGSSAGHVAEVAGSGAAGAGAAGHEVVAGSGGSAGSAPAPTPVEVALCTLTVHAPYAHGYSGTRKVTAYMSGTNIDGIGTEVPKVMTQSQATLNPPFSAESTCSVAQCSGIETELRRVPSNLEIDWFVSSTTGGVPADPQAMQQGPCTLAAGDMVTGYHLTATLGNSAIDIVGEVRGFKAQ